MKVIAVYSIKGGVGKTASSVNLAYLAARAGYKTLLCDLDPQGSTSYYFRIRPSKKFDSGKLIDENKNIEKYIRQSDFDNLDILPSDFSYRNLDLLLDNEKKSKKKLKSVLKNLKGNYDIVFLDCPPNITLFSENIFNAADIIAEPCIPTTLSILTHEKLYDFLKDSDFNTARLYTFYSMVELRKKMHKDIMEQNTDNSNFLNSFIPYCSDIEKMGIHLQPVFIFAQSGKAAKSYEKLWNEFNKILF